ncbi:probable 2-oxoglutarate-dependent dioxygenase AOP1 isoform X1 [Ananas comosus]|uniref:2-oxoglutarate-dependent dioxygenase DAO n=1 Tax=Ananas comosus TaxID=4615 RepID=A0A6P5FZ18_ANACO|nr:probable 2-oxoglutarate-dependent dioxygenase AOP1 isoform X1 [Ananas comosus]
MGSEEMGVQRPHPNSCFPTIDFSGVEARSPEGRKWSWVREQVTAALTSVGCFEALYPPVGAELRRALFGEAVRGLFALPREAKLRNAFGPEKPFHGYLGGLPGLDRYESLAIVDAPRPDAVRGFAHLMWPRANGNPAFCETVHNCAKLLADLEKMVRRMVLESLGVLKYYEAQNESTWYLLRLAEYGAPHTEEKRMGYYSHQDTNTLTIICQDQVGGLEVQTKDGQWIPVEPSRTSFVVMAGNALRAWTNGRVYAPFHRVWMGGEETRYSVMLFSNPQKSQLVQAPEELVDENHPALFKPYDYNEYMRFCLSEEGAQIEDKLMAFCGVSKTEVAQA